MNEREITLKETILKNLDFNNVRDFKIEFQAGKVIVELSRKTYDWSGSLISQAVIHFYYVVNTTLYESEKYLEMRFELAELDAKNLKNKNEKMTWDSEDAYYMWIKI